MQLVANQQLVKNRVRLGLVFHFGAMAVFASAAPCSRRSSIPRVRSPGRPGSPSSLASACTRSVRPSCVAGGPRNRQEEQLGQAIRGLDDRYKLYAFLSSSLPDYILVSPAGVQVLVARTGRGQISCVRDKWSKARARA